MTLDSPSIDPPQSVDTMARTLDGEAEGCGVAGMTAVACVIVNRANHPRWWGNGIVGTCLAPYQFSCWLPGPDKRRIEALTDANPWFAVALGIANRAVAGKLADITDGADSYYAKSMKQPPEWSHRATLTYQDDWHRFYRVELPAPSGDPEAPNISHVAAMRQQRQQASETADDLNASELASLSGAATS